MSVQPPLFVGGTGRSGTHAVAKLIGRHSHYFYVSRELRFHTDRGGLPDLLDGRIDADHFVRNMREYYWRRTGADGRPRGLHSKFGRRRFEAALAEFEARWPADHEDAAASVVRSLLDPLAEEAGKPAWIEQTPQTAANGRTLHAVFPDMRMIHMLRDGRDVAASVASQHWGPRSMRRALRWWEKRLRAADAGTEGLDESTLLTLELEDLVMRDREATYARLLGFLGLEDEVKIRKHFDKQMSESAANVGRWRAGLSERAQARVDSAYDKALERMRSDGVRALPS